MVSPSSAVWGAVLVLAACAARKEPAAPIATTSSPVVPRSPTSEPTPPVIGTVELGNPSDFARPRSPLWVSYYDLGIAESDPTNGKLRIFEGALEHPSEAVDTDFDGAADTLLALVDLDPRETLQLSVVASDAPLLVPEKLTQAELSHKVGGAWQPRAKEPKLFEYVGGTFQNAVSLTVPTEHTDHSNFIRYEGPGIESDKVGYRVYLDWRNGFDIFGKKVSTPVLQGVGQDGFESYHQMSDWGMDILKVGLSLGAGGFGFWNARARRVELVSKVDGWHASVTRNGNLSSAFRIAYRNWQLTGHSADVTADFAMTGGSRLVEVRLGSSAELPNLAVGLVKHEGVEVLRGPSEGPASAFTYLATWGEQSLAGDQLGMAVLVPIGRVQGEANDDKNVALALHPEAKRLDYHFLAAWQGEPGGIQTKESFVAYLDEEIEKLTLPNRVRLTTALADAARTAPLTAGTALDWSARLADSELARKTLDYRHGGWDAHRKRKPTFEYDVVGLQPLAYDELHAERPDARYAAVLEQVTGSYVTKEGRILEYDEKQYNIDAIAPGRNLLRLFERTGEKKYELAARALRRQLERQPRTSEGAFWHKQKYPAQLWLDGVYMGMPFLAEYSARFEQGKSFPEVVREFEITRARLRDDGTGLYFHAFDESKKQSWADPVTGRSREFWARGMGWLAMALVDVLEILPEGDARLRAPLLEMTTELSRSLVQHQDASGTWWQVVDKPGAPGNYRESTASAMFTYFFAKATRRGYLDASYRAVAEKAYRGLLEQFVLVHPDGRVSMTNQCLVAGLGFGRDGSYRYYMSEPVVMNDPKGNGPFILAGVEMARLLGKP